MPDLPEIKSPADLKAAFSNRVMTHSISGGHQNLSNVLTSGVLACTERRRMMGVQSGLGMSEHSDTLSGGASSVFLRMQSKGAHLGGAGAIDLGQAAGLQGNVAEGVGRAEVHGHRPVAAGADVATESAGHA